MIETFPDIPPSYNSDLQASHDVIDVTFGDGYTQRAPNGINSKRSSYSLNWVGLTLSERDSIVDCLDRHRGVTDFYWTPWDDVQQRWTCDTYNASPSPGNYYGISATFVKSFNI